MPWDDWQFYVVTAAAAWGAWMLLRQLFPRSDPSSPACGACATGAAACAKPPRDRDAVGAPLVVLATERGRNHGASAEIPFPGAASRAASATSGPRDDRRPSGR